MKAMTIMIRKGNTLQRPYEAALRRYLKEGSAGSVHPAQSLGRRAVALRLETLDLALIHEQALLRTVEAAPTDSSISRKTLIHRAGRFFAKAILPMETTHRAALETNVRLSELNEALSRRSRDLAASNRTLQREIARRMAVEESLRRSEERSNRLLELSRHTQEKLRLLSRRVLSAQEEERKRISRELHDVIAQMLTGINVRLTILKKEASVNTKGLSRKILRAQRLVEKSVAVVHRFARDLRPAVLDDLGLIPAVHSFLTDFAKNTGIRVKLTASAGSEELGNAKRAALYRVVQEAMTNVARHAQAGQVAVSIRKLPNAVCVQVKDDGKSFDVDRMWRASRGRHLGMLGMRERVEMVGGTFTVTSVPGLGSTIQAHVPFGRARKSQTVSRK